VESGLASASVCCSIWSPPNDVSDLRSGVFWERRVCFSSSSEDVEQVVDHEVGFRLGEGVNARADGRVADQVADRVAS